MQLSRDNKLFVIQMGAIGLFCLVWFYNQILGMPAFFALEILLLLAVMISSIKILELDAKNNKLSGLGVKGNLGLATMAFIGLAYLIAYCVSIYR